MTFENTREMYVENTCLRLVFCTFLSCSQMQVLFYHSVIQGLGQLNCAVIHFKQAQIHYQRCHLGFYRIDGKKQFDPFSEPIKFEYTLDATFPAPIKIKVLKQSFN